jgi:hypothetical protein
MYTSCGWFFDDLSGIETVQVIQYAGRVVQLAQEIFGENIESEFLEHLKEAKSNVPEQGNGRDIYGKYVKPCMVDLNWVVAHYAISSLFEDYSEETTVNCYRINNEDYQTTECGKTRLAVGRTRVTSEITGESALMSFGVFHLGDHVINAGVRQYLGEEGYDEMVSETIQTCDAAEFTEVIRLLDKHFGSAHYSLRSLFRDEQRKVLGYILESTMSEIESAYRQLYETHFPPMRFLSELGTPVPKAFHAAAELILNIDLHRAVSGETLDTEHIENLLETAASWRVEIDNEGIGYELKENMERMMTELIIIPDEMELLNYMGDAVSLAVNMPFSVDLWNVQNLYWQLLNEHYPTFVRKARRGDQSAAEWTKVFELMGERLKIRIS